LIVPECDAILNCNRAMKYASYQVTASFPMSKYVDDLSQERWTALQYKMYIPSELLSHVSTWLQYHQIDKEGPCQLCC
jgi:hypothetical protein